MILLFTIAGWLFLGLLLVFGYAVSTRLLQESCPLLGLVVAPAIAASTILLGSASLWPYFSPTTSFAILAPLLALACWKMRNLCKNIVKAKTALYPSTMCYLAVSLPLVLFYALFGQTTAMVVDGDLFIHVSEIGLFQEGHYPPKNPFFGLPTHGHFGRQIIIAALSLLSHLRFLEVEWLYTCGAQLVSFSLLFLLAWRTTRSQLQGCLASGFGFFGANLGGSIGIADTTANHNPTAVMFLMLGTWLVVRAAPNLGLQKGLGPIVFAGVLLGTDALVYETHFVLMLLASPLMILLTRLTVRRWAVMIFSALVIACTCGGVLTKLASDAFFADPQNQSESASQQRVQMEFPKQKLFQVRTDNVRPSRPFEGKWRPWRTDFTSSRGYVSIWSTSLLDVFWYPTWLFPLSLCFLLKKRHILGLWFSAIAVGAFFTPAVVDFGFFEGETLRWLYVVAISTSVCFALALGEMIDGLSSRWGKAALLLLPVLVGGVGLRISMADALWTLDNPGQTMPLGRPGIPPTSGLIPRPNLLLEHHLSITKQEREAARWIRHNTSPEAKVLWDDLQDSVNARATLIGLQGRFPVGYEEPKVLTSDPSGYPRSKALLAAFEKHQWTELERVEWDYLVLRKAKTVPSLKDFSRTYATVFENEEVLIVSHSPSP